MTGFSPGKNSWTEVHLQFCRSRHQEKVMTHFKKRVFVALAALSLVLLATSAAFSQASLSIGLSVTPTAQVGSTVTGVGIADVAIGLTAAPNPGQVGAALTYTLSAFNIGDDDARGVAVGLILPQGAAFVSAPTGCTHTGAMVICTVGH